jgi:ATP-dependent DNA helicase RecG
MPRDRLPVRTYLVPPQKRTDAYEWIREKIAAQEQVFIVCPFIEESEKETIKSVRAATREYEHLSKNVFTQARCVLIHGKVPSVEKKKIMADFRNRKYDILVATPVVEVGIDIPGATVMVIEGAERYGLAQLHQLRGRVGRGSKQSHCLVFTSEESSGASKGRLAFFAKTQSGMELAEYDLKHRGAGEMYGTRQHGEGFLKVANLGDVALVKAAQQAASSFLVKGALDRHKALKAKVDGLELEFIGPN